MKKPRRSGCRSSRLRKRYGCFHLPNIPGATVKEAKRQDVSWLARTDPQRKEIEFSVHWDRLPNPDAKKYIALHEAAHLKTGTDHDDRFYAELKRLIEAHRIPWKVAYELESYNCHRSH